MLINEQIDRSYSVGYGGVVVRVVQVEVKCVFLSVLLCYIGMIRGYGNLWFQFKMEFRQSLYYIEKFIYVECVCLIYVSVYMCIYVDINVLNIFGKIYKKLVVIEVGIWQL